VLAQGDHAVAGGGLRVALDHFERHSFAAGRIAWHWYPRHIQATPSDERVYLMLVDATINLFHTGSNWLELTLDIAGRTSPVVAVNAAIEVA
jgi:hypothetical protein